MKASLLSVLLLAPTAKALDFGAFLDRYCLECHDTTMRKGDFDLSLFHDEAAVLRDREVWRAIYEKVESHQMPPPKQKDQPTAAQRAALMTWIMEIASRPDPALGQPDPGKPPLRRLTRLEYNNAVRDLFGLQQDVLMFPERLPLGDKSYFQPASGMMPATIKVPLREYGQKYPVLCRNLGLPGDNRAEHGYRNRGDAMDFSPLLLEKYLAAATEIVQSPELSARSETAARLFGAKPPSLVAGRNATHSQKMAQSVMAAGVLARNAPKWNKAEGIADNAPQRFFDDLHEGFLEGVAGVFDGADGADEITSVPGKGGLLHVTYAGGAKSLTINPNEDLWVADFASVKATSGSRVFTNRDKGRKTFELTFGIENGDEEEGVSRLGVFVLGRSGQSGSVTLTAKFTDDTESSASAMIAEGPAGTTFFSFAAVPGESVKALLVDGSQFSGDYVVLDDLGFITSGQRRPVASQPTAPALAHSASTPHKEGLHEGVPTPQPAGARLKDFMERAFRRPVSNEEANHFLTLFESERKRGKTEADAMKTAVAAVLSAPAFLYVEANGTTAPNTKVSSLEDWELATRLSTFLWSSTPDDELLTLAKEKRLQDSGVLEAQARRMLRDSRSRELSESFAVQWLRLDQLYTAKPDPDLFKAFYAGPQGKSTLHGAMLTEALLLFETVHVEDRSVLDFIAADYTWLNASLARHYAIPFGDDDRGDVSGGGDSGRELKKKDHGSLWRRVKLADAGRGGFTGMAAPMVITSLPFRTSPVKRGAWMLETIFNRPPTEPKVAFAIENDTKEAAQQMSVRERFEAHRNQAACYSCHIRLDPPGFALERFNAIGQWDERADARGEWAGRAFDGPAGFKAILTADPREFTRGFIEHLLSYALGRELHIYDMPVVEKIEQAAMADGWKFSRIVVEIVKSYPFTHVRQ